VFSEQNLGNVNEHAEFELLWKLTRIASGADLRQRNKIKAAKSKHSASICRLKDFLSVLRIIHLLGILTNLMRKLDHYWKVSKDPIRYGLGFLL
jgi:hypothetical protein